jgi:hypothetical protein
LRTLAALLAFFAIFIVVWLATVLAWGGVVWLTGYYDREDAIGLLIALYVAPLIAFAAGVACAMLIVTPRPSPSSR